MAKDLLSDVSIRSALKAAAAKRAPAEMWPLDGDIARSQRPLRWRSEMRDCGIAHSRSDSICPLK